MIPSESASRKSHPNTTSIFIYDGDNPVETVNPSGSTVARYTQGWNIDEPLAMQRGTATDYYEAGGRPSVSHFLCHTVQGSSRARAHHTRVP